MLVRTGLAALWPLPGQSVADAGDDRLRQWRRLVEQALQSDAAARIEIVNAALNRLIEERADPQWTRWPTAGEVIARGGGDCRSFAVLKFFTLLCAGHEAADVRVLYTILQQPSTPGLERPHLVAWARAGAAVEGRVLDNLNPFTLPLAQRPDLRPVFSLDCEHLRRGAGDDVDRPAHALRPWRELLERAAQERGAQSLVWISTTRPLRGLTSQR